MLIFIYLCLQFTHRCTTRNNWMKKEWFLKVQEVLNIMILWQVQPEGTELGITKEDMSRRNSMHSQHSTESAEVHSHRVSLAGSVTDMQALNNLKRRLPESPTFKLAQKYFAEPQNDRTVSLTFVIIQTYYKAKKWESGETLWANYKLIEITCLQFLKFYLWNTLSAIQAVKMVADLDQHDSSLESGFFQ